MGRRSRRGLLVLVLSSIVATALPVSSQPLPDLVERVRPSIAFVLSKRPQGIVSGTGFVVHPDGYVLTARHVVDSALEIIVALPGRQPLRASLLSSDAKADIALLRIPISGLTPLRMGDSTIAKVGEDIVVIGFPLADVLGAYEATVTKGIISAIRTQEGLLQLDAAINPGVSGGPVFNSRGEVIGIAVLVMRGAQSVGFAVPINMVRPLLANSITAGAGSTVSPPAAPSITPVQPPRGSNQGALIALERTTSRHLGQVAYSLEVDKAAYESSEMVRITFAVLNTGTSDVDFLFLSSQLYDFIILRGTTEIARWSIGRPFRAGEIRVSLAASQRFVYPTLWKQFDQNERPIEPGRYTIHGYFLSWPNQVTLSLTLEKLP